jgi:hypothetical protein
MALSSLLPEGRALVAVQRSHPVSKNRILTGQSVTCLIGNSKLPREQEKALRRKIILRAMEMLATPVEGPTVCTYE